MLIVQGKTKYCVREPIDTGPARRQIRLHFISESDVISSGHPLGIFRSNISRSAVEREIDTAVAGGLRSAAADVHHKGGKPILVAAVRIADIKMFQFVLHCCFSFSLVNASFFFGTVRLIESVLLDKPEFISLNFS